MKQFTLGQVLRLREHDLQALERLMMMECHATTTATVLATITKIKELDEKKETLVQQNTMIKNYIEMIMKKKQTLEEPYKLAWRQQENYNDPTKMSALMRIQNEIQVMNCSPDRVKIVQL
jgi:hypothetical protein